MYDTYEKAVETVRQDGMKLEFIHDQTDEICKIAVTQCGYALKYVQNQTDEICKMAIQRGSSALCHVKNQTYEICKFAVQLNGSALQFVRIEQTDELCEMAVRDYGVNIRFVKNQTDEICKLAIQESTLAFLFIKEPTDEIYKFTIHKYPDSYRSMDLQKICKTWREQLVCNWDNDMKIDELCTICLGALETDIFESKCGHYYHLECIREFTKDNDYLCSLCKKLVV